MLSLTHFIDWASDQCGQLAVGARHVNLQLSHFHSCQMFRPNPLLSRIIISLAHALHSDRIMIAQLQHAASVGSGAPFSRRPAPFQPAPGVSPCRPSNSKFRQKHRFCHTNPPNPFKTKAKPKVTKPLNTPSNPLNGPLKAISWLRSAPQPAPEANDSHRHNQAKNLHLRANIKLPNITGYATASRRRTQPTTRAIPPKRTCGIKEIES